MKELLEAGVHFGHQTKRWNPRMKEYIFGERNGIYIIDLQKTLKMFKEASKFVQDLASDGKIVLFVGTKRQAQDAIAEEAQKCGAIFVIDSNKEQIAVREARKLGIPVVAVVDTNCDPTEVDYVIPGNDDALRAIRLFASKVADSVVEGSQLLNDKQAADLAAGVAQAEAAAAQEPVEGSPEATAAAVDSEDINMEEVLGPGTRKKAASAEAPAETPEVEHQTY